MLDNFNRRNIEVRSSIVQEVLPEYFQRDYPNLIQFLEGYFEFSDSDETSSLINDLYTIRDIEAATTKQLDQIFAEIAQGASRDYFKDPREALRSFANFYRVKGTRYSAEGFFRAFFQETVEIDFPKEDLFIVSESLIGPESLKFIQNGALYQIFSILVKSSVPIARWKELYRRFVHPAGFFIGGQVVLELSTDEVLIQNPMPNVLIDSAANEIIVEAATGELVFGNNTAEIVGRAADGIDLDSDQTVYRFIENKAFGSMSIAQLAATYSRFAPGTNGIIDVNSPTFDEDTGDSDGVVRMSNEIETMDFERFELFDS